MLDTLQGLTLQGVTLPLHNDSWDRLQHMCFTCQNTLIGPLGVLFKEMGILQRVTITPRNMAIIKW